MKIKWYGHSAFKLTTKNNFKIIIDPYQSNAPNGIIRYAPITDDADIVLISHDHTDHNDVSRIKGSFIEIRSEGIYDFKGIKIMAIRTFHDKSGGVKRGNNLIFVIEAEELKIVHVGDIGHLLEEDTFNSIGKIHVLMLPVGGTFSIDSREALEMMSAIKPLITLPMHYRTEKTDLPLAPVDDFIKDNDGCIRRVNESEIDIVLDCLPAHPEIVLLRFAN